MSRLVPVEVLFIKIYLTSFNSKIINTEKNIEIYITRKLIYILSMHGLVSTLKTSERQNK